MAQPSPAFATPLPQSNRSEVLEWRFPKPYHQYVLTGKSRAAWHTSFVIPQLNLLLDAGVVVNKERPKHIFLTHGHSDHVLLSPAFVKREDPPDIYCPVEMKRFFDDYILAKTMMNRGGHIQYDEAEARGLPVDKDAPDVDDDGRTPSQRAFLGTHVTHPVPEYTSLSGNEIKALRTSGVDITAPHTSPPPWLRDGIPVVITECSFLYEEHRAQAEKTKHTYWPDLEVVVRRWPETTFVIMHFSMRYSDEQVSAFFKGLPDPPRNIVVWVDGHA
ncbi:hypothetical protein VdG1_03078 [Verticillium dahliae VDG1]|nr:hypothetical protein VdG1_03078 [Verticillium dahliae VDG1]